jgi:Tfp pilus assembly protein PilZ
MYLEGREALPIGVSVSLRFHIPTQPEAVEVAGDVRWVVTSPTSPEIGIGIRFQGLRARDVWALNRFFQTAT